MSRPRRFAPAWLLPALTLAVAAACSSGGKGDQAESRAARAERISSASQLLAGDAATGRAGDYLLSNGRIRAVVQDLTQSRWLIGLKGGALTDIDIVRTAGGEGTEGGDFLKQIVPTLVHVGAIPLGASVNVQDPRSVEIVGTGGGAASALVRVVSGTNPFGWIPPFIPQGADVQLELTTDYILDRDAPYLKVVTTVKNQGGALADAYLPGDVFLLAGSHEEYLPGRGFDFPGYALDVDYLASVTPGSSLLTFREGGPLAVVADVSGFLLALHSAMPLPKGGEGEFTRYYIAGNGDLASVLGPYFRLRGVPTGSLAGRLNEQGGGPIGGAIVSIYSLDKKGVASDQPVSTALTDAKGSFSAELQAGGYLARLDETGRAKSGGASFVITVGATTTIGVTAPPRGELAVRVTDASGQVIPSRVRLDGPVGQTVLVTDRDVVVPLRPGRYQATASRGFEWTRDDRQVDVPEGGRAEASFTLTHVVDTTGYVAADFHIHGNQSSDSNTLVSDQIASIAGMGIELGFATDHDHLTDYRPVIEKLGLSAWLRSGIGDEVSTTFYGHFQGFPLTLNPDAAANGAVDWFWKSPPELFDAIRADPADQVLQVNHPNADTLSGYFDAIGYDNATGQATRSPQALGFPAGTQIADYDFDCFEAMNGSSLDAEKNVRAFATYSSLTNFGRRYTMTGNSDSHSVGKPAGYPRNLVRSSTDDPARLDVDEVLANLKAHRSVISGGLFLTMTVDGAEVGSEVTDTNGVVEVGLRLQAPPWMDAKRITLYANGAVIREIDVPESQQVLRYEGTVPVAIEKDTWFLATARGDVSMAPVVNDIPYAVTNPIWVDRDGNGRFDPPAGRGPTGAAALVRPAP